MAQGKDAHPARRVLLKLSGEAFGGGSVGIDTAVIRRIAGEIRQACADGNQVAVVVGGGNFFRGAELSQAGLERARADYMGMLGTVMNCLALQDFLEQEGQATRVQTAITMGQVAEAYIPLRAIRHLEKGRVVILVPVQGYHIFQQIRYRSSVPWRLDAMKSLWAKTVWMGYIRQTPKKIRQLHYSTR